MYIISMYDTYTYIFLCLYNVAPVLIQMSTCIFFKRNKLNEKSYGNYQYQCLKNCALKPYHEKTCLHVQFFLSQLPWLLCHEAVSFGLRNAMAANNNYADQSVRMCRLILTFIVCMC